MDIIEYKEEYRAELEQMLAGIQNFERRLNPDREEGEKIAKGWVDKYDKEKNKEIVFLGKFKGEIIGFVWIYISNDELNKPEYSYLTISDVFIKDYYRGKGFGRELLAFCEKYGKERKVRGIYITALVKNVIAHELYKNLGFVDHDITLYKKL